jgi:hypothetical protein
MDDLIGRLVANAGVDRTGAEHTVGIILQFLMKEGPTEKVCALIMPGAGAAMLASSLHQLTVALKTWNVARGHAGEDAVGAIVGAIPGLGKFA